MKSKKILTLVALSFALSRCDSASQSLSNVANSFSSKPANLRINLTDAPNENLKEVWVNISHIEMLLHSSDNKLRLVLQDNVGLVDLLKLQDGVQMNLADLSIPAGMKVSQIRLILHEDSHSAIRTDGSSCELKTPSAQKTGLKIVLKEAVEFESGKSYSMLLDFDAKKSIVQRGNGTCLLKPVLKLPSFRVLPLENVPEDGGVVEQPGDDLVGGDDSNDSGESQDESSEDGFIDPDLVHDDIIIITDPDNLVLY